MAMDRFDPSHTAPNPLNRFWWNSNLRTIFWRSSTMQNFISIRRRGWSRRIASMTEKTISGVHVSSGSAETLVRIGGIPNHHSIAYSLSDICAKNYPNRLMCIEVIVCNISVVLDRPTVCVIMVALCNRAYHYIYIPFLLSFFLLFFLA